MDVILSWLPIVGTGYAMVGVLYWCLVFDADPIRPSVYSSKEVCVYFFLAIVGALVVIAMWPALLFQQLKEWYDFTR